MMANSTLSGKISEILLTVALSAGLSTFVIGIESFPTAQPLPIQEVKQSKNSDSSDISQKLSRIALRDGSDKTSNKQTKSNNQTAKKIWSGASAGFQIQWTTDDLTAAPIAGTVNVFSARDFAGKEFEQYYISVKERKDLDKDMKPEIDFYNRHFRLLSVVGSLISFEDDLDASGKILKMPSKENFAYRDEIENRFLTVDLAKADDLNYISNDEPTTEIDPAQPGKAVLLTDLFSEQDILRALLKDKVIKQALLLAKKSKQIKQPTDLEELMTVLEGNIGVNNCSFDFADDYLTRFAFHHIENGRAAVRLSLSPGTTACKGEKAQIGLLLPIPSSLKESLALANSGKQGFLMNRQSVKFTPEQETDVGFDDASMPKNK